MTQPLTIIFAGTPDFAATHLQVLLKSEHHVIAVYTQPDRPAGRGKKLLPSAVKQIALSHEIPLYQPINFKESDDIAALAALKPDIMIVVAYGLLLPKIILDIPRLGCINVHGSLLPRWRGAAPIQRAIAAGDKETGIGIMQMEVGLDTGPIWLEERCDITSEDTSDSIFSKLGELGPKTLLSALPIISAQQQHPTIQHHEQSTYAHKLTKNEAIINWQQSAEYIARQHRAFTPWPGTICQFNEHSVKILALEVISENSDLLPGFLIDFSKQGIDIQTEKGIIRLQQLQLPGKKPMAAQDFINARRDWLTIAQKIC